MGNRHLFIADVIGRIGICTYSILVAWTKIARTMTTGDYSSHGVVFIIAEIAAILFIGMMCVVTLTRMPQVRSARGVEPYLTAMGGTFLFLLIAFLPPPMVLPDAVRIAAMVLMIIGFLSSAYMLAILGRSFSIAPGARALVTTGPYSIVRHPLYLTEEIFIIGMILFSFSPWTVFLGVVHWCLQLRRMSNEETVLWAAFPDYRSYAERVPKVIPFLHKRSKRAATTG
ncbi:phospholipid methyltransferase protein [Rhizobium phaseoli]|uniref:methyltransferase family protein n=1 Tax=Rhizobium phaseoli TaxID=396 RepID=UPI0007F14F81|nr:isoprenylcysteine carboxylmethyltransferase family protein [Rhizobium phaseoli]ANL47449.1 phospholipid methyltransferase protein [Rhizobium phaseoli]